MDPYPPNLQNDCQPPPVGVVPQEKPSIAEGRCFLTWALYAVITPLGGFLLGLIFGGIIGAIMGAAGADMGTIQTVGGIVGFLLGTAFSYLVFRFLVMRLIRDWVLASR